MWIPRWLGEIYSKLYYNFELSLFTFSDALNILSMPRNKLMVAFSHLHKNHILTIFERGKPRKYRLLNPLNFLLLSSGYVNPIRIPQERYLNIIYDVFRAFRNKYNLRSFAVYGSVARGSAKAHSDIDFIVISDDFKGSIASRLDEFIEIDYKVKDEIRWLIKNGIYVSLSIYPMRSDEAKRLSLIFLDLLDEAKIIYDDGILMKLFNELRAKLSILNAKKVMLGDGSWYWDLKPDYKSYEVIQL